MHHAHKSTPIGLKLEHSTVRSRVHPEGVGQTVPVHTDQNLEEINNRKESQSAILPRLKEAEKAAPD